MVRKAGKLVVGERLVEQDEHLTIKPIHDFLPAIIRL